MNSTFGSRVNGNADSADVGIHLQRTLEQSHNENGHVVTDCGDVPFPLLVGEKIQQKSAGVETSIFLTNYRLFVAFLQRFYNIPVKCIECVELQDMLNLHIIAKDGKVFRVRFDSPDKCSEWWALIMQYISQLKIEELFAFEFLKQIKLSKKNKMFSNLTLDTADGEAMMFVNDIKRMEFNMKSFWRTTELNSKFEICETYPKLHIVPAWITDDDLQTVAQFRALRRFPSVIWRSKTTGAVIARSSQPELGWFGWRCEKDEILLSAIAQASKLDATNENHDMTQSVTNNGLCKETEYLLVDARSYPAAVANRAKGGGCECQEYYPNCDIQFMGLPNIHAIRKSFQSVRLLCLLGQEQSNWYSSLEATRWLHYLSALIRSSLVIVEAIHSRSISTLVHCSDGWDRTTQLVSLSELLLDPYYRTVNGFRVLVEREWLGFGHKFSDRCGHISDSNQNEQSPVFFQWLDVVHQIMRQYPSAFEFNESFLIKLVQHVYSCLFGTFLCNSVRERRQWKIKNRTVSVWDLLLSARKDFYNYMYDSNTEVLYPSPHVRYLELWEKAFMPFHKSVSTAVSQRYQYKNTNGVYSKTFDEIYHRNPDDRSLSTNTINDKDGLIRPTLNKSISTGFCNGNTGMSASNLSNGSTHQIQYGCIEKELNGKLKIEDREKKDESLLNQSNVKHENETCMTDSSQTLTDDLGNDDRCYSYDDSFVNESQNSNSFSTSNQTCDSPLLNKLQRTKSVPDVTNPGYIIKTENSSRNVDHKRSLDKNCSNIPLAKDFSKHLDVDGLPFTSNFVDEKLLELGRTHLIEISKLQKKFERERETRILLQKQNCVDQSSYLSDGLSDALPDDLLSISDSINGERSSVSSVSNEDGWEQIQFEDVQPTRWFPDHLSPNCSNCSCTFTLLYRRHHCRKCGGVFCDTCSNYKISLPEEQLYTPVRVCLQCYERQANL